MQKFPSASAALRSDPPARFRAKIAGLRVAVVALWVLLGSPSVAFATDLSQPAAISVTHGSDAGWRWRRVPIPSSGQGLGLTAVAIEPARASGGAGSEPPGESVARVAIGDLGGVSLREEGGAFRFAARTAAVTDLSFGPDGSLWIASLRGLWRLSRAGRLSEHSPAPGELARSVRRVEAVEGLVVAGTDAGAFVSQDGSSWQRLADGLPSGPVPALGLGLGRGAADRSAASASTIDLWLVVANDLWRVGVRSGPDGLHLEGAAKQRIPGTPVGVAPVDVAIGLPGVRVAVAFPQLVAFERWPSQDRPSFHSSPSSFRSSPEASAHSSPEASAESGESEAQAEPLQAGPRRWEVVRPVLPPGARVRRLVAAAGRTWLATDRGLLSARGLEGPWRRAGLPAGSSPAWSLAASAAGDALFVAGEDGLLFGSPILRASARPHAGVLASASRRVAPEPDIRAVQRAGLRYLRLSPQRMDELRRGLSRRGWLPTLSVRLAAGHDRQRQSDYDEAFLSGETRHLYDREKERSLAYDASLNLSWDFGDVAFDADAIDLSREARLVISLRDSVLDEINQLYYERRGLLLQLADSPGAGGPDARQLELRAAELAAGLDAWTGGWFSEVHAARSHAASENAPE